MAVLVLIGCAGAVACSAPGPKLEPSPAPPPPRLAIQPLTWEKLGDLEMWLDGPGPAHYPDQRVEAELLLAEGRLTFAKQDRATLPSATLARRIASAEFGFRRALADGDASTMQRHRASRGLDEARTLRAPKPVESSAPRAAVKPRATWGARAAVGSRLTRQTRRWTRITVHHSAPPNALSSTAGPAVYHDEIRRIQRYHMDQTTPRCGDIGYHFLIDPKGAIYEGRELTWQGAHSSGANNRDNIGICVLGDFRYAPPTAAALESLERLLDELRAKYDIARDSRHVLGHGELKVTACPGTRLMEWVRRYRR